MATEAQVFITGIKNVLSFRGTLNHGIQPSTFLVDIVPQKVDESLVEIAVKYPHPVKAFELKECLIDSSSYSAGRSGLISTLYIKDFRWKWAYKHITLLANIRRGDGEIIIDDRFEYHKKKMAVADIIEVISKALGAKINIQAKLPDDYYPEIVWDNYNAAVALNDILSPLALRIVPSYEPDVISIHNAGIGAPLPQDDIESYGTETNPREKPKRIRVVSAPVLKTVDLGLYPVIRYGNRWEKADESSYRPAGRQRWGEVADVSGELPSYFSAKGRTLHTEEMQHVEESVFSWYEIQDPVSFYPPKESNSVNEFTPDILDYIEGYDTILRTRYEVLRGLQNFICEAQYQEGVKQNGQEDLLLYSPRRPFVYGAFNHEQETDEDVSANLTALRNSVDKISDITLEEKESLSFVDDDQSEDMVSKNDKLRRLIVPVPFALDIDNGLVKFSRRVVLKKEGDSLFFPELCLRVAIKTVNKDGTFKRLEHVIEVDPKSPADEIYVELPYVVPMWEFADGFVDENEYRGQLKSYAEQIFRNLSITDFAGTASYAGIKKIELDGVIQTVSWNIGQSGARTTATYNHDTGDSTTLSFNARQAAIELGKVIKSEQVYRAANVRDDMGLWDYD